MPTTKTAEKEMRAANKRKVRNRSVRSETKTDVTTAEKAISTGNLDAARTAVKTALSTLDKESERGRVHRNSAARRKSRLMKKLNNAVASSKDEAKST